MGLHRGKRISLIGTGRMGNFHARVLTRLGSLSSVVDTVKEKAESKGNEFGVPFYTDIEEMLENEQPEGVVVAVPTKYHEDVVITIIESNWIPKVMMLEKPVADTVESALNIKKIIGDKAKVIVGHSEVYNPVVSKMTSLVNEGALGKPRTILFQRRSPVSISRLESIGDIFEDLGVHDFDILTKLISGDVYIYCKALRRKNYYNAANILITKETNGEIDLNCTMLLSREYAGKKRTIEIEGSQATMQVDLLAQIIELRSLEEATGEGTSVQVPFRHGLHLKVSGEPLQEELLNVIDCIDGRAEPLVSLD
ncbi:MAG: Gfo/Idh/MocA family protein, partial [Candidatus Hodarchaeales archaeon]